MIKKLGTTVALALVLTACGSSEEPAQPTDLGVGHIHGLGMDPATGSTYVAGHYGLFTLESGKLVRVGDRDADHMGFTVAGPKTFYASGHPAADDIGPDQPPHLGLIKSTDSGLTWEQVALAGKADFHSLQVAGKTAYGYDSQTGQIWRGQEGDLQPAAQLDLLDLAAGADAPNRVYATTPEGVKLSEDGGKSFATIHQP